MKLCYFLSVLALSIGISNSLKHLLNPRFPIEISVNHKENGLFDVTVQTKFENFGWIAIKFGDKNTVNQVDKSELNVCWNYKNKTMLSRRIFNGKIPIPVTNDQKSSKLNEKASRIFHMNGENHFICNFETKLLSPPTEVFFAISKINPNSIDPLAKLAAYSNHGNGTLNEIDTNIKIRNADNLKLDQTTTNTESKTPDSNAKEHDSLSSGCILSRDYKYLGLFVGLSLVLAA